MDPGIGWKTMNLEPKRQRALLALIGAGLLTAVLAAAEPRIPMVADLCGRVGGGCRDTAAYTLLGVPVALLGLVYYGFLLAAVRLAPGWIYRLVMAGAGVEATFFYALVVHRITCPFCLLNLVVMVALTVLVFKPARGWEALAVGLLLLTVTQPLFIAENRPSAGTAGPGTAPDAIVARVGEDAITAGELERAMAGRIYDARMALYGQKRRHLEQMVQERLLALEARRRGTTEESVRAAALEGVTPVSAADVNAYLAANPSVRANWRGDEAELRRRVADHLKRTHSEDALKAFTDELQQRWRVAILLAEPPLPLTRVPLGVSPSIGPADAPVTVVEFSDYRCPACRQAHEVVVDLRRTYAGRVRWVFKDLPLERHRQAFKMAEAARCAQDQERFWEYQDLLFRAPGDLDAAGLVALAQRLGMDPDRFQRCLAAESHRQDVLDDIQVARAAGVDATPTFIVNGRLRPGLGRGNHLEALIQAELEAAAGR